MRSTPDRGVRVQALAGDNVLCSWARNFTFTVLSPVHTGVEMGTEELNAGDSPALD